MISDKNPLWYKDAVIYQIHVQAFYDSNNDGIGDFKGLTEKLDYVRDLGVTAIWLLPFYPSPLKDGGYDISDYTGINPIYGSVRDFKRFLREAHKRNLRVITELVLNHTSSQHPWFKRAKQAKPGSGYRDYYVWSDKPDKYLETRIIFKDFESSNWSYDSEANAYYWHRFYSHQPDLNFDNESVHKALFKVIDFWFNMGVDGLRLDAIPYLYEREGTNCENLPETHQFLKKLRKYVDDHHEDKMLLAEANQWTEDAVEYFGDGDECHMSFHFPVMPRLFMGLKMEDRFPIVDILDQTPDIPENCQWAIFLRNHDELTLEMVTDEERDYMYKTYARNPEQRINLGIRRRLAPLLENDRRKIELMNMLLFSLPGSPVIYYGDELGMGDNFFLGDRNGVRTPMQWSPDKNAGFSKANPQQLYLPAIIDPEYHFESINVENQARNVSSLLWWTRNVIAIRKRYPAFSRGKLKFLPSRNSNVITFTRELEEENILLVANLSRHPQLASIDLGDYEGMVPRELFSLEDFPEIEEDDYNLSLGPYGYFWFSLKKKETEMVFDEENLPELSTTIIKWNRLTPELARQLEDTALKAYVKSRRWYRDKGRKMNSLDIEDVFSFRQADKPVIHALLINCSYTTKSDMKYFLPVGFAKGDLMYELKNDSPASVIAECNMNDEEGIIFDALYSDDFQHEILEHLHGKRKTKGKNGELQFLPGKKLRSFVKKTDLPLEARLLKAEQSNTSIIYGDKVMLKLYRGLEEGLNPEIDVLEYLTEKRKFQSVPQFTGQIEYRNRNKEQISIGIFSEFVPHEKDAWSYTQSALEFYFSNILSRREELKKIPACPNKLDYSYEEVPDEFTGLTDYFFLEMVELLGKRTGEMHKALAARSIDERFHPEGFSLLYQKSLYQSFRGLVKKVFPVVKTNRKKIPETTRGMVEELLQSEKDVLGIFEKVKKGKIASMKTRIHGDYHLGQVLFTGKDFILIDFEGEPARTLSERHLKYCPLRDVAGMLRSFHYAVYTQFFKFTESRPDSEELLRDWINPWYEVVSALFLHAYLKENSATGIIPDTEEDLKTLLHVYLMEKAVYELGYEINNRPGWTEIPVKGIQSLLA
ncbi:MAG: maltose alpha-D-glucosyltransferase [Bacteroidales bacterium]|nr:maltose alpha-D-glucosyltransferase [Bacteroidales bacterium]MCF8343183.1 maltose alpha-D-glucosyltransferase [Bacteroidales bacterium]MCF8377266.1 maltose alpha-D-glucosyltransferase [Bacteroidales bacterium]MCF8401112.1 maltose alpha-D-glucosyltransferase [Bacteroidales bacterium]